MGKGGKVGSKAAPPKLWNPPAGEKARRPLSALERLAAKKAGAPQSNANWKVLPAGTPVADIVAEVTKKKPRATVKKVKEVTTVTTKPAKTKPAPMTQAEIDEAFTKAGGIPKSQDKAPRDDLRAPDRRVKGQPLDGSTNPGGREPIYNEELAKKVLDYVLDGYSMRKIAAIEGMPSVKTHCRWLIDFPKFRQLRDICKAAFIESDIEEAREIVDDSLYDWKEQELASGQTVVVGDHEHIARSKMRVDFRLKHAAMLAPQKYGAKIDMKHSGQVSTVVRYHKPERKKA